MAITVLSTSTGAGASFAHTITVGGTNRMFIVASAHWSATYDFTGIAFNGKAGTLLMTQSGTTPSYLLCQYWMDKDLPGAGASNVVISGAGADVASTGTLVSGVDQTNPIVSATALFTNVLSAFMAKPPPGWLFMAGSTLLSNANTPGPSLTSVLQIGSAGNSRAISAVSVAENQAALWGYTSTGDVRTSLGVARLREALPRKSFTTAKQFIRRQTHASLSVAETGAQKSSFTYRQR